VGVTSNFSSFQYTSKVLVDSETPVLAAWSSVRIYYL
jgi:hypothetical protein